MSIRTLASVFGIVLIGLLMSGCQPSKNPLGRLPATGSVTLDGAPLDAGEIQFQPKQADAKAVNTAAVIKGGAYSLAAEVGLLPGTYAVSITSAPPPPAATSTDPVQAMQDASKPPPADRIPRKYNQETTLKAVVTKEGPNKFDFDLKSKD